MGMGNFSNITDIDYFNWEEITYTYAAICFSTKVEGVRAGLVEEPWTPEQEVGGSIFSPGLLCCVLEQDTITPQKYW